MTPRPGSVWTTVWYRYWYILGPGEERQPVSAWPLKCHKSASGVCDSISAQGEGINSEEKSIARASEVLPVGPEGSSVYSFPRTEVLFVPTLCNLGYWKPLLPRKSVVKEGYLPSNLDLKAFSSWTNHLETRHWQSHSSLRVDSLKLNGIVLFKAYLTDSPSDCPVDPNNHWHVYLVSWFSKHFHLPSFEKLVWGGCSEPGPWNLTEEVQIPVLSTLPSWDTRTKVFNLSFLICKVE